MKVKVTRRFKDKKEDKLRARGDIFDTTEKRMKEINAHTLGPLVEVIEEGQDEQDNRHNGETDERTTEAEISGR